MHCEPQREHHWLQRFVGEWTYESDCSMGPGQPSAKFKGSEKARSVGGLWVICDGQGEMPGGGMATMMMTLGYDPVKKRFVGTWIGSMMANLWVYDGSLDAAERVLTLNAEGPTFAADGKTAKYQDIIEFISNDHRVLTSRTPDENGNWVEFMKAHYHRTK